MSHKKLRPTCEYRYCSQPVKRHRNKYCSLSHSIKERLLRNPRCMAEAWASSLRSRRRITAAHIKRQMIMIARELQIPLTRHLLQFGLRVHNYGYQKGYHTCAGQYRRGRRKIPA